MARRWPRQAEPQAERPLLLPANAGGGRGPNAPCETCTAAGITGDAAMHWHRKCPIRKAEYEKKKEKKEKRKAAKAAKLAAAGKDDESAPAPAAGCVAASKSSSSRPIQARGWSSSQTYSSAYAEGTPRPRT